MTNVSSTTINVGLQEIKVYAATRTSAQPAVSASRSTARGSATVPTSTVRKFTSLDLAPHAVAQASSYGDDQGPEKAIDGVVSGYIPGGGDYTKEWASDGQGAGAIFNLTWAQPVTASRIVLYDRPNLSDNILGATIYFS